MRLAALWVGLGLAWMLHACSGGPAEDSTPSTQVNGPTTGNDDAGSNGGSGGSAVVLPEGCNPIEPTYAGFAQGFFASKCGACHTVNLPADARTTLGVPEGVNFDTETEVAYYQMRILQRAVIDRDMPPMPSAPLSDCEVAQLASYLQSLGGEGACMPQCDSKDCGPDACGGICGTCTNGEMCGSQGVCVEEGCVPQCQGVACGDDGCGGVCGDCGTGFSCDNGACVCAPQCTGRNCGDDGCGGSCGTCNGSDVCDATGNCLCIPTCNGEQCGDDGCGGVCGTCMSGDSCVDTVCDCVPDCTNRACGDDGCGGDCGSCTAPGRPNCNTRTGNCVAMCMPDCSGRECGDDGCGGSCGPDCGTGQTCNDAGQCMCEPSCVGKACGDDGCGDTCGTCPAGLNCSAGQCGCEGDCTGRECGSDGCGGSCGSCVDGLSCDAGGSCVAQCVPDCAGKDCGDNGCGGTCGSCGSGQSCEANQCVTAAVTFDTVYAIFTQAGCGSAACHGGAMPKSDLDLSTKPKALAQLVDVPSAQCGGELRVTSGDPSNSYLINKLTGVGMCMGSQMPKADGALSAAEIDTIRTWISGL